MGIFNYIQKLLYNPFQEFKQFHTEFVVDELNKLSRNDITELPDQLVPSLNFYNTRILLNKQLCCSEINPIYLIRRCVIYSLAFNESGVHKYFEDINKESYEKIKMLNSNLQFTSDEFCQVIKQSAFYINKIKEEDEDIVPNYVSLYAENLVKNDTQRYKGVFDAFYLFIGFNCLVGGPIGSVIISEVDNFVQYHCKIGMKSLNDILKKENIKAVYIESAKKLGGSDLEKLNYLHNAINNNVSFDGGNSFNNVIEWIKYILTLSDISEYEANNLLEMLKMKFSDISIHYLKIMELFWLQNDFEEFDLEIKLKIIGKSHMDIHKLLFHKVNYF